MQMNRIDSILLTFAVFVVIAPALIDDSVVIQPTRSLARGIYIIKHENKEKPPQRGDIVSVTFDDVDRDYPDLRPELKIPLMIGLLKIVAGVPGDMIRIDDDGIAVNGKQWGPVFEKDRKGIPLPRIRGELILKKDEFFVMTPAQRSFDSRYFGPVKLEQLKPVKPLILIPNEQRSERKVIMNREVAKQAVIATMKSAGIFNYFENPHDNMVTEIMINPDGKIFIEELSKGMQYIGEVSPDKVDAVLRTCASYVGEVINQENPMLQAEIDFLNYARIQGMVYPITSGPMITIRLKAIIKSSLEELCNKNMLTPVQKKILVECVLRKDNVLITGQTSSGKTTLLNALLPVVAKERIITIEDTRELDISVIENAVALRIKEGVADSEALLKSCLRVRPDRILVGELRYGETAVTLLNALSTGHSGSISTLHAEKDLALDRLEQLILQTKLPKDPKHLIGTVIDLIAHIDFDAHKGTRKIVDITRIHGYDGSNYVLEKLD